MTTIRRSERLASVKPSITLAVTSKARELRARGVDIVSFGAGEPDFDTPAHIKEAARGALAAGAVAKYTDVRGIPLLREAVATELGKVHGIALAPEQVIVTVGAKHALFNLFLATLDPGDEVIVPAPYWVSYPDMIALAGGVPVIVDTRAEDDFALDPDALSAAITERTRALVLNTPSNPTGSVYDRGRLAAIAEVVTARGVFVVSDDIYRSLCYGDVEYASIASLGPEIAARTVLIDGVSKTYAMTGWRIGFAVGPPEVISAMAVIQGQSTSNASHIAQVAALAAITGPQECVAEMRAAFDTRRRLMVQRLRAIPEVICREPGGAFYAFPDLSAYVGRKSPDSPAGAPGRELTTDVALCEYLVDAGVAIVPGSGFGAPGFARLSYACSAEDIAEGIRRIADALTALA